MLCERPDNVVWTLYFDQNPNIATTLSQRWPMLANIETMFRQRCVNVVAMSLPTSGMTLTQDSGNIVSMLWHCHSQRWWPMFTQHSGNIVWMLSQWWCPTLYLVCLGLEWQLHSNFNFLHICYISMHLYIGAITSTHFCVILTTW